MKLNGKNILVTGGLGAIGSYLVNKISNDNRVIILDNMSSGNLNNIKEISKIKLYKHDLRDIEIIDEIFEKYNIDIVFHLAANFANQNSVDRPILDCEINAKGTLNLLLQSQKANIKKFIYASSSGVYGSMENGMVEAKVGELETPYYIHKLLGEYYCNYFHNQYGLNTVNIRIFNSYGPGELNGIYRNVIPNFFVNAIHQQPLTITGSGLETRDFTYVGDIVDGLISACIKSKSNGETINLGSGKENKIIDLANKIITISKSSSNIVYQNRRSWDKVKNRKAIIKKAKSLLDWEPKVNIDDDFSYCTPEI